MAQDLRLNQCMDAASSAWEDCLDQRRAAFKERIAALDAFGNCPENALALQAEYDAIAARKV
ncbi:MAG: hypothetical protein IPN69_17490 [Acidobacteria bacterium]|nr:hypothetical protein [Acidobacteriota bacterium]